MSQFKTFLKCFPILLLSKYKRLLNFESKIQYQIKISIKPTKQINSFLIQTVYFYKNFTQINHQSIDNYMSAMMEITKQDNLALRKFGLHVQQHEKDQLLKQIKANPVIKQEFQKIKSSIATMLDENLFLQVHPFLPNKTITQSHQKISEIPQNNKVIYLRDNTFAIRAINPEQIQSLTERAFFNSFSLERIMLKDIESEEIKKTSSSEPQKQEPTKKEDKANFNEEHREENYDSDKCICGKFKQTSRWIECANQSKCRGSGWYHIQCSGLPNIKDQDLDSLNFICMYCKRAGEESNEGSKRVKRN